MNNQRHLNSGPQAPTAGPRKRPLASAHMTPRAALAVLLAVCSPAAWGQTLDSGDTAWVTMATALVLFMTIPGLGKV